MQETSLPRPRFMLNDLGAIEHDGPTLVSAPWRQAIDAVAGRDLRRPVEPLGVGQQLAQTQVAVLAAVEAPEEDAVEIGMFVQSLEPMLGDRGLALAAGADERRDARIRATQRA